MFTLIKREIEDNIAYFVAAVLFSAALVGTMVLIAHDNGSDHAKTAGVALSLPVYLITILGFAAMGVGQMHIDRTRKVSAFLSTLPVSRSQILLARIATGVLAMLVLLVPIAVTAAVLVRIHARPYPGYPGMFAEISASVFLAGLACYCLGMQMGISCEKLVCTAGCIFVTAVLSPLVIIKGFWGQTVIILLLLIAASLIRTWQKFTSTFHLAPILLIILGLFGTSACAEPDRAIKSSHADTIHRAVAEGKLAFKLTTPDDLESLLGPAIKEMTESDGGMESLVLGYADVQATFGRMRDFSVPFTLYEVVVRGKAVDIGQGQQIVLRNEEDLKRFDRFWGFTNVSLANIDLRNHLKLLETRSFDSRTVWPEPNKLPEGFDPARVLEEGKNPGLGIRSLHKQGIDGKGVGIAIIDQPLVKNHKEYIDNIVHFEEIDVQGVGPQMHGPAVASIAVGKNCGVAPAANLHYYAIPMWKWKNCQPYCDVINKILQSNKSLKPSERIRVVSISTGMFSHWNDFTRWEETLRKAEQQGVLIVTCDTTAINYGTLTRIAGKDPDDPNSYRSGRYGVGTGFFLVPAGNRTTASHEGSEVYIYWTEAGMSWATPYIAGLAALAYQVDPEIEPKKIVELWTQTAVYTDEGLIVNPTVFIECVQNPNKISSLLARVAGTKSLGGKAVKGVPKSQNSINERVAQLDIKNATPEDVIRIFGKPSLYKRGGQTFKEDNLPDNYAMTYSEGFSVSMLDGHIEELRFQKPGYVFRDSITVGSTLDEVPKVLGPQTKIMEGKEFRLERGVLYTKEGDKIEPVDGVLYKDIGGRKGYRFYDARADQGVRMLFMNDKVVVLCVTRTGPLIKKP
jgi:subtilisin family serine protease